MKRFPCPGCQADLEFDPKTTGMKCPYCGHEEPVPQEQPGRVVKSHGLKAYLTPKAEWLARLADNAVQVTCDSCSATTEFTPPEVAGECPFCGARLVAQPIAADPLIAPQGVLPFAISKKEAVAAIRKWLASRWFAPDELKKLAQQEGIYGVYLPYWTYDSQTTTRYTGERGQHYFQTERYCDVDEKGQFVWKERKVRKTRWQPATGSVKRHFSDLTVPATTSVSESRLQSLEPWDLSQVVSYEPAFLSGFRAQRYQRDLGSGFERAKELMAGTIYHDVCKAIGGDEQRVHRVETSYSEESFRHLLFPVWIAAYRFNGKVYQVLINARNGDVQGARPYSMTKVILLALALIALIALFLWWQSGSHPTPEV